VTRFYALLLVRRSLLFWLLVHIAVLMLVTLSLLMTGAPLPPTEEFVGGKTFLGIALIVGFLLPYDAHIARESLLIANFGVNRNWLFVIGFALSAGFETIAGLLL
jgi:hypothetical protein